MKRIGLHVFSTSEVSIASFDQESNEITKVFYRIIVRFTPNMVMWQILGFGEPLHEEGETLVGFRPIDF